MTCQFVIIRALEEKYTYVYFSISYSGEIDSQTLDFKKEIEGTKEYLIIGK